MKKFSIGLITTATALFAALWSVVLSLCDGYLQLLIWLRRRQEEEQTWGKLDTSRVSVVIPTWNGKELLEQCLKALRTALRPGDEVIVVDNASEDGTREYLHTFHPWVRVLALETNGGFRGGCNAGLYESNSDIVIFLNNDMVVEQDFLDPLLQPFQVEPRLFAVTSQIYFWDKQKKREETGLTRGVFRRGLLRVGHDVPGKAPFNPVLYAGGGSSAYDKRKLLILGGFDDLYDPFYVEDLDLSYRAWMRNWPSVIASQSIVYHKHRGTIGTHFRSDYIERIVRRNNILFAWRNLQSTRVMSHMLGLIVSLVVQDSRTSRLLNTRALFAAIGRYSHVLRGRLQVQYVRTLSDHEILRRSTNLVQFVAAYPGLHKLFGSYDKLRVLVVCPYSPVPTTHGGAVRMYHLIKELQHHCEVHVVSYTENVGEEQALENFSKEVSSVQFMRRIGTTGHRPFYLSPDSVSEFYSHHFTELIQRVVDREGIHIVQYEYTQMAQYIPLVVGAYSAVTEHDVSVVRVARQLMNSRTLYERLRGWISLSAMLYFEQKVLASADIVFSASDREGLLLRRLFRLNNIVDTVPNGTDATSIITRCPDLHREGATLLFVGNFRHSPNVEGYLYFHEHILPIIRERMPSVDVLVVGGNVPAVVEACADSHVKILGLVDDLDSVYQLASVAICPIVSGAGVRMKLLESMAYGVPFVSTRVGAEGLHGVEGDHYFIADNPEDFATKVLHLLLNPSQAIAMAQRARELVKQKYDWATLASVQAKEYEQLIQDGPWGGMRHEEPIPQPREEFGNGEVLVDNRIGTPI